MRAGEPRRRCVLRALGASLEAPGAYELEERKVVTVLFADLVGSTAQAESHDPEEVRTILSAY